MADYISKKRLYLDADGKVTDDDSKGVSLLVGENGTLDEADAIKYGLEGGTAAGEGTKTDDKEDDQTGEIVTDDEIENENQSGLTIETSEKVVEDIAIPSPCTKKRRGIPKKTQKDLS